MSFMAETLEDVLHNYLGNLISTVKTIEISGRVSHDTVILLILSGRPLPEVKFSGIELSSRALQNPKIMEGTSRPKFNDPLS